MVSDVLDISIDEIWEHSQLKLLIVLSLIKEVDDHLEIIGFDCLVIEEDWVESIKNRLVSHRQCSLVSWCDVHESREDLIRIRLRHCWGVLLQILPLSGLSDSWHLLSESSNLLLLSLNKWRWSRGILVVAGPSSITIANGIVCIVECTRSRVHVSLTLSKNKAPAVWILRTSLDAEIFVSISPLSNFIACWSFAETLRSSIIFDNHRLFHTVARPSSISISSRIVVIVECTCSSIHVSFPLSKKEALAFGIAVARSFTERSGFSSPFSK